jgi:hypothetical protein
MFKNSLAALFLFLFVYGISFAGIAINSSKIVVLAMILFCFLKLRFRISIHKDVLFFGGVSSILMMISLICTVVIHQTSDFQLGYGYFLLVFESLLGSILFYKLFLSGKDLNYVLKLFILIAFIQALIIIAMLMIESFRELVYAVSKQDMSYVAERYGGFRGFGLASSVTYDLAVLMSIPLMFISYLVLMGKVNKIKYLFVWVTICLAIVMTGRTGIFGILLSLLIILYNVKTNTIKVLAISLGFIAALSTILPVILYQYFYESYVVINEAIVPYATEIFSQDEYFVTRSTDILLESYFMPEVDTFLWGDGYYSDNNIRYRHSDSGYIKHLIFYGLLPSLLLYGLYIITFTKIYNIVRLNKYLPQMIVLLMVYFFIAHLKGDIFIASGMNIKLLLLIFVCFVYNKPGYKNKIFNTSQFN